MIFTTFKYHITYYYNKAFDIRIIYKWTNFLNLWMSDTDQSLIIKKEVKNQGYWTIFNEITFTANYDKRRE